MNKKYLLALGCLLAIPLGVKAPGDGMAAESGFAADDLRETKAVLERVRDEIQQEFFSNKDYGRYMKRIKNLDAEIYKKLKEYEQEFGERALLKAGASGPTVLVPSKTLHGQPLLVLPVTLSDAELERHLASYRALQRQKFIPGERDFYDDEYQHYLNLIKDIDHAIYQELRDYEWQTGRRALVRAVEGEGFFPSNGPDDPLVVALLSVIDKPEDEQRKYLEDLIQKYYKLKVAETEKSVSDDGSFPPDEYEEYMAIINEIDPSVYQTLRRYESTGWKGQALSKADTGEGIEFTPPCADNGWMPFIDMESLKNYSQEEKVETLTEWVAVLKNFIARFPVIPFPDDEYEHYMRLIETYNKDVYEALRACEKARGEHCLLQAKDDRYKAIIDPSYRTGGYPLMVISPVKDRLSLEEEEKYLKVFVRAYDAALDKEVSEAERVKVLHIIKKLAPELYAELVAVDPTGKDHIVGRVGGSSSIYASSEDGLPVFQISKESIQSPDEQLTWTLGHELSHYVHRDFEASYVHKAMKGNDATPQEYAPGKIVSSQLPLKEGALERKSVEQLPFEETFKNAKTRAEEYAADRGSVIYFGTSIDAGLRNMDQWAQDEIYEQPEKETFKTTHPLSNARAKHLESLREEVAERKKQGKKPQSIDWKGLIQGYKKKTWQPIE